MTLRVAINPELLRWALSRSGRTQQSLASRFKKLGDWLKGELQPTLTQLEDFARATHTPIGYFFLPDPPEEALPIPDLRTMPEARQLPPSANLLDTIYICQQRQAWYQDYALLHGEPKVAFVGSAKLEDSPAAVAARMRNQLNFYLDARRQMRTWTEALREFIRLAEESGVLVMVSG
ncbi:DNA-binding protein, partial [Candidatus Parcubacteria bacterium]